LVQSTCDSSGLLLKPSLPLAAIDRSFSTSTTAAASISGRTNPRRRIDRRRRVGAAADPPPAVPTGGHVWATHTAAAGLTWWFILAIAQSDHIFDLEPWALLRTDLWPPLPRSEEVVVYDWRDPAGTARLIKANEAVLWMVQPPPAAEGYHSFSYLVVAPTIPTSGGWVLLGEPGKLTSVSEQRGWSFDLAQGFLLKILSAAPGENVTVSAWKGGKVYTQSTVADERGEAPMIFQ
jgi:hypothetical protein